MKLTKKTVLKHLEGVIDPELGFNIVDLGLVYDVKVSEVPASPAGGSKVSEASKRGCKVVIKMTLTSPGCPLAPIIHEEVERVMMEMKEVEDVELELVWDPPWSMEKMSKEAKLMMGLL